MGFFDGLTFNPQGFGGQGGGLLDLLKQAASGYQQYQPQPQNMDALPIAVGNYMMPRHGPASLYEPQQSAADATIPPNAQMTQGQMAGPLQPSAATAPAFLAPQPEGGLGGAFRGLARNAHTGPIGALLGAIGGGMGMTDPDKDIARQNLRAQYEALVPLMGPQKALLSVMNPEAAKSFLAEITDKPTHGVIGEDAFGNKQYGFIHPTKGTVVPAPVSGAAGGATAGAPLTVTGPDGKQIPIPAGVDPKKFRQDVTSATADAATGKKTEVQAKSEKFGNKMEQAERALKDVEGALKNVSDNAISGAPIVGGTMATNWALSEKYQLANQARSNFITALLRDESGAAIGTQEFKRYERELFPQPGDSAETVNQKREARRVAIEAMKKSAGPGYKSPEAPAATSSSFTEGQTATNPKTGQTITFRNGRWQ